MHELIVTPVLDTYLVLRPGSRGALRLPVANYRELAEAAAAGTVCPGWLADACRRHWDINLSGRQFAEIAVIREPSPHGFVRATYELNLGCNYDCEHCYLGLKRRGR